MGSFFRKWFGGRAEPPAHLAEALQELLKLARSRPLLQSACKVLEAILLELFSTPGADPSPPLTLESAQRKLADGTPLLRAVDLPLEAGAFRLRWLAVCAALQQENAEALAEAVSRQNFEPLVLLSAVLAGRPETVPAQAAALQLDATEFALVLRLTALPVLSRLAQALADLRKGVAWEYGYCPTCGSWPILAEARGLEQLHFLRCGLCASAWEFSRFRCPFCANEDHHSLGYFHVEGEERLRVTTCDLCHGYVKVIATLSALSEPRLLVADLATLHLDLVAADRGFFGAGTAETGT